MTTITLTKESRLTINKFVLKSDNFKVMDRTHFATKNQAIKYANMLIETQPDKFTKLVVEIN